MTPTEVDHIVAWIHNRWTNAQWTPTQIQALHADLANHDHQDALTAIRHLRDEGAEWIEPAYVVAGTQQARTTRLRGEERPALEEGPRATSDQIAAIMATMPWHKA